ncbi:MAG: glycosyltransferase [Planctomycetales bacterium]|nr:glycosyltransferase [Planctomycetales bacterium]
MRVLAITPELPTADDPGSMAPGARQIQSLRDAGIDIIAQDMRGIPKLKYLQAIPRMYKQLGNVDLIHAHFGYCGLLARLQFRKPIVVSFMGDDLLGTPIDHLGTLSWGSRQMVKAHIKLAPRVDQVIVKSQEMANVIAPTRSHVIPNGVDIDLFQPQDRTHARQQLGWADEKPYVLFPGNPDNPRKGFQLASQALDIAKKQLGRDIEMVPLWGVAPDDVTAYMNASDAMWMTSFIEGSPNVVKEAMACNVHVIGVPVGDVTELLDGVAGSHVCQRDPEQLGTTLATVLTADVAPGGRQAILDRGLDIESVANRIIDVYRLALGDQSSQSHGHVRTEVSASTVTTGGGA